MTLAKLPRHRNLHETSLRRQGCRLLHPLDLFAVASTFEFVSQYDIEEHAHDTDDQGAKEGRPEAGEGEAHPKLPTYPAREIKQIRSKNLLIAIH